MGHDGVDLKLWQYGVLFCPFICRISIEVSFTLGSMGLDFVPANGEDYLIRLLIV